MGLEGRGTARELRTDLGETKPGGLGGTSEAAPWNQEAEWAPLSQEVPPRKFGS